MNEQNNKTIAEAMGLCWHEPNPKSIEVGLKFTPCVHCKELVRYDFDGHYNPDFYTANGFFQLLDWLDTKVNVHICKSRDRYSVELWYDGDAVIYVESDDLRSALVNATLELIEKEKEDGNKH